MRRSQISTVLLLGTLTALLTGCSRNPMSPDATGQGGAQMMAGIQTDDVPGGIAGGGTPSTATTSLALGAEARLTVGRFTLDLHKNSLKGPATITMHVASEDAMEVTIEVSPASANNFQVAAELSANLSDQPGTDYLATTVYDWDGTQWVPGTDVAGHPNQQNVVSKLKTLARHSVAAMDGTGKKK